MGETLSQLCFRRIRKVASHSGDGVPWAKNYWVCVMYNDLHDEANRNKWQW